MKMENFTLELDKDGILVVWFKTPDSSMNTFTIKAINELNQIISDIKQKEDIKGAVFTSGKDSFCAGVNLKEVSEKLGDLQHLPESEKLEKLYQFVLNLNMSFRKLETCGKPVIAAVNGLALGGGFEFILACHRRIIADNPKIKLGLPEVLVGLIPGAGGTQRLPRLIGAMAAAPFILQGKLFSPQLALSQNIIDQIVPEKELIKTAKQIILDGVNPKQPWDHDRFKYPGGGPYHPKGLPVFSAASAMVRQKTFGNYPAQRMVLSAVYEGSQLPMDAALRVETRYFCKLFLYKETLNMVRSLFISKQELSKTFDENDPLRKKRIRSVAVIGAGFMGAGIAYVSAYAGFDVILLDIDQAGADKGFKFAEAQIQKQISRGKLSKSEGEKILSRIQPVCDYQYLKQADLIIEAVFEDYQVKEKVISEAMKFIKPDAILGTNTSTLSVSRLAEYTKKPESFAGIHFFSPVHKMLLVELIKGKKTSQETIYLIKDYIIQLKKTPIIVRDVWGFYANRCVIGYTEQAMDMLEHGVAPALIENGAKLAGMPVGPLALTDEVSIELGYHIALAAKELDKKQSIGAKDRIPEIMVQEYGRLGRKNSKGFYEYHQSGEKSLWSGLKHLVLDEDQTSISLSDVKDRFLYAQALEAARCLEKGIIEDLREADLGSILGWGFAPFTGGVISFIDLTGAKAFVERSKYLYQQYGAAFQIPKSLEKYAKQSKTYYKS